MRLWALGGGGCVAHDYRLMHRGMGNSTGCTVRPAVLHFLYAHHRYKAGAVQLEPGLKAEVEPGLNALAFSA